MQLPTYTIFIGNPGVGKSTLLNAIVGSVQFKSGVTFGPGLTSKLQMYEASPEEIFVDKIFVDTPGLDNVESRKQAAEEICSALKAGEGHFKLVFVVTVEAGRVKATDMATIKLVLNALPENSIPYGIIVNKLSRAYLNRLESNIDARDALMRSLDCFGPKNHPNIMFYERMECLEDRDDALHNPTRTLIEFLDTLESITLSPEGVEDIQHQSTQELMHELEMERKRKKMTKWDHFAQGAGTGAVFVGLLTTIIIRL